MSFLVRGKRTFVVLTYIAITLHLLTACRDQADKEISDKKSGTLLNTSDLAIADSLYHRAAYDSAYTFYKKAADKFEKQNNKKELIATLLKISDLRRSQGNLDQAVSIVDNAEKLADPDNNDFSRLLADIWHKKGLLLIDKGNFDQAITLLNESIRKKVKLYGLRDTSLSLNYNGLGTAYFYKGDYNNALENYTTAYDIALKRKNPEDADLAMFVQNIGIINAQKGEYEKADAAFMRSLQINEKLMKHDDPELSMINLNVGRMKALLNKDNEALQYYNKAEAILMKNTAADHPNFIYIYSNKGQTYVHVADYEKALVYFNKALALANKTLNDKHPQILSLNMNIGYVYEKKKDYKNALKYYLASIPDNTENPSLVKTYSNLASLYNSLNDKKKADEYYKKALVLSEKFLGPEHPETGLFLTRYGYFLMYDESNEKEIEYFNKALAISRKHYGEKSREVSNIYTHIGNYYLIKNDLDASLKYYQKAIIALVPDFNNTDIAVNPDIKTVDPELFLVNALNGKSDALNRKKEKKYLMQSLEAYKLAVKVLDKARSAFQDEESKLMISELSKFNFQKTVELATNLYNLTKDEKYLVEAFDYCDKGKSAVLINSMHELEAQHFGKVPENILALEKDLKLNIGTFKRFIYEEKQKVKPDANKISGWESRMFDYTVKYDSLNKVLEQNYPEYYKFKYSEPVVALDNIKKALEPDRALIEYMLSDSLLYIFAIDNKSFRLYTEMIDSVFYQDIQSIVSATNNNTMFSATEKDFISYSKAGWRLYEKLVKPFSKEFNEKKLIIIPDGEIGYISFDLLLTSMPDTALMDFRRLPYLIHEKVISYSTSALLQFSGFQQRERKATRNLLAMAPSYDNLTTEGKTAFTDENGNKVYLLPIPGVEKEMEGIKTGMFARKIKGADATEARFKKEVAKYNILHLAMHTLINNSQPMLSKLVFYQDNDTVDDGMLNTYELFSMDLNAGLAVLSACNTGNGKLLKGEGIMNLARGFIYAGVPGIVMTMWSVDDESGARIVNKFYQYLEKGMDKDEALRQAKLDLLAEGDPLRSHPFYWAAYVNIGDNSPMKFRSVALIWTFYGLISLVVIGAAFFLYRRVKTNQKKVSQLA